MIDISSLCDEWSDSERMRVMFAPMRNKELNPESFNSKIKFWTDLIHKWCTVHNKCSFTIGQLEKDFQRDGSTPHCLADVLGEALKSGKIVDTKRYASNLVPQESWGSWAKSIGWRAAGSFRDTVLGYNPESFTIPEVADNLMEKMLRDLRNSTEAQQVLPHTQKKKIVYLEQDKLNCLDSEESKIVLQYLVLKKKVSVCEVNSSTFLKLSTDNLAAQTIVFDETDVCLIKINLTIRDLDIDIESKENECKNLRLKVKQLLKSDSRTSAKSTLKRQKMVEDQLQKKTEQKFNLESLLDELLNAESNKTVVQSLKIGSDELKLKLKDLNSENVDEVMDDLQSVLSQGDELSESISRNIHEDSFDMEDLEKELHDLSKEESDLDLSKELQTSLSDEDKVLLEALDKLEVNELEPSIASSNVDQKRVLLTS